MARVKSNVNAVFREMERRLSLGMEAAVGKADDKFVEEYSANPAPPHSSPGEVPHIETGQLVGNIDHGIAGKGDALQGRAGVKGTGTDEPNLHGGDNIGGMAAYWLQVNSGRQGLDDVFLRAQDEVRDAFRAAAK